jgi:hypothetical protein
MVIPDMRLSPVCSARATALRGQRRTADPIPDWLRVPSWLTFHPAGAIVRPNSRVGHWPIPCQDHEGVHRLERPAGSAIFSSERPVVECRRAVGNICRENGEVSVSLPASPRTGLRLESWFEPACTIDT